MAKDEECDPPDPLYWADRFVNDRRMANVCREHKLISRALIDLTAKKNSLFEAIKHGDAAHQAWLKKAIEDHFK